MILFQFSMFWAIFMFFHINFTVTIHNVSIFLTLTLAVWRLAFERVKAKYDMYLKKPSQEYLPAKPPNIFRYIMINDPLLALDLTFSRCKKLLLIGYGESLNEAFVSILV